jgi:hypothetical protein
MWTLFRVTYRQLDSLQYRHIQTSYIVSLVQSGVEGTDARNPFRFYVQTVHL